MISNLNRSTFMGHLGADAKQANGTAPVTFSIAVSYHWNYEDGERQTRTDWQNVVVFGKLRKYAPKLKKGDRVYVEAEARNNNYERKVGTETVKFYETEFLATEYVIQIRMQRQSCYQIQTKARLRGRIRLSQ